MGHSYSGCSHWPQLAAWNLQRESGDCRPLAIFTLRKLLAVMLIFKGLYDMLFEKMEIKLSIKSPILKSTILSTLVAFSALTLLCTHCSNWS